MNLNEAVKTYLEHTKAWAARATVEAYESQLRRFQNYVEHRTQKNLTADPSEVPINPVPDVATTAFILEYKTYLYRQKLAERSIFAYMMVLRTFLKWAVKMRLIDTNPYPDDLRFVLPAPKREAITEDEFHRIVARAEKLTKHQYWPVAIMVAWHTGLRLGDVATLRNDSLNIPDCSIKVVPRKTRRHHRMVEIPIPEDLMDLLKYQNKGDYVFPGMAASYRKNRHYQLSSKFSTLARSIGIAKGFHCFRHGAISRWLAQGVQPTMVSDMTGINLSQIMTYTHIQLEDKRAALGLKRKETAA